MGDPRPNDVPGDEGVQIAGGTLGLGQAAREPNHGFSVLTGLYARDLTGHGLAHAGQNGDVLGGLPVPTPNRLLPRNDAPHPGQGGELHVEIEVAVAEQDRPLDDGARVHSPLQAGQGRGKLPIADQGEKLTLREICMFHDGKSVLSFGAWPRLLLLYARQARIMPSLFYQVMLELVNNEWMLDFPRKYDIL